MAVSIIGPKFYAWDNDGNPLAFGKLYTYQTDTLINKATYQSEDQIIENSNPVILNGEGYADVYLDGSYKMILTDADDNEMWTSDPVSSPSASEWVNCLDATYVSTNSVKVTGNATEEYGELTRVRVDNGVSGYDYSTVSSSSYAGGETTIVLDDAIVTVNVENICSSITTLNSINSLYYYISTENLLTNTSASADVITTKEYFNDSSLGGAIWAKTGVTGTPGSTDFDNGFLVDGLGNQRKILDNDIDISMFGAKRDDDSAATANVLAIQSAFDFCADNNRKCVFGGIYSVNDKLWAKTYLHTESYAGQVEFKWTGGDGATTPGPTGGDAVFSTVPRDGGGNEDRTQFVSRARINDIYINLNGASKMIAFQLDRFSIGSSAENLYANYPNSNCIMFYIRETYYASFKKLNVRDFYNTTAVAKTAGNIGFYMNGVPNGINSIIFDKCIINKYQYGIYFYSEGAQGGLANSIMGTTIENCGTGIYAPSVTDPLDGFASLDLQVYMEGNDIDVQWEQEASSVQWRSPRFIWGGSILNFVKGFHYIHGARDLYTINITDAFVYSDFNNPSPDRQRYATTTGTGFFRIMNEEVDKHFDKIPLSTGYNNVEGDGFDKLRELTSVTSAGVRRPKYGTVAGYNGKIYSLDQSGNNVYEIDSSTGIANQSVTISGNSKELIFHPLTKNVYVISNAGLQVLNIKNLNKISDIAFGSGDVTGLASSKDYIIAGDNTGKMLYSIDPVTASVAGSLAITFSISEIAFYAPKNWIVATHKFSNTVSIHTLNESTGAIALVKELTTVTMTTPIGITVDDKFAYVADTAGDVHVIDLDVADPVVNKTIVTGGAPEHLAYSPLSRIVCAIDKSTGIVYEINCKTLDLAGSSTVTGSGVDYIEYNPNDNSFLVGSVATERTYLLYPNSYSTINIVGEWATASRPTITPTARFTGINTDTNKLEHTRDFGTTWYDANGAAL